MKLARGYPSVPELDLVSPNAVRPSTKNTVLAALIHGAIQRQRIVTARDDVKHEQVEDY